MTHLLDDSFGLPRKTVMSQRDVPGMTKSIIPILKRNGEEDSFALLRCNFSLV